jgi:site-specific DNA-cytosine methylase
LPRKRMGRGKKSMTSPETNSELIIDLCCGIGRFSENAISIDINRKCKPTIIADIRYLPLKPSLKPKLVHASPPCTYFSNIRNCHGWGYNYPGIAESFELVAACFRAFDYLEPKMWTLENPAGGILSRIMPTMIETEYSAYDMPCKKTHFWTNRKDAMMRAMIPQDVRQKILEVASQ